MDLRKLRGYQPTGNGLDETNPPTCGSCLNCCPHLTEIDSFISSREDVVYMCQTDPFVHSLLTRAQLNKSTVADLLENMLVMYYTMSKKQSDELLEMYLNREGPIIKMEAQE